MDIYFIRSTDHHDQTIVTRQDGVRLSAPECACLWVA
jgi:hypothetical protein